MSHTDMDARKNTNQLLVTYNRVISRRFGNLWLPPTVDSTRQPIFCLTMSTPLFQDPTFCLDAPRSLVDIPVYNYSRIGLFLQYCNARNLCKTSSIHQFAHSWYIYFVLRRSYSSRSRSWHVDRFCGTFFIFVLLHCVSVVCLQRWNEVEPI